MLGIWAALLLALPHVCIPYRKQACLICGGKGRHF
jgi:hypothetical protein